MEISTIKQQLTLSQVLHHYGLKPDKHHRLHCPFHTDKTPSMQVYYKTHSWTCFSSNCTAGSGDAIAFCEKMEKDKHKGILVAKSLVGGTATPGQELSRIAVLTKVFTYFKNAVPNSKPAQAYISSRSLRAIKLQIGYNSGQFHHGQRKDKHLIESCIKYGLLLDRGQTAKTGDKAYSSFGKSCIVFSLRNKQHQVVSLYFRSIIDNNKSRHFYLKNRQGLYPGYPEPKTQRLILTESIIDCATLQQLELKDYEVLALYGTNGLTAEHTEAVSQLKELEEIILFFDGDQAGSKAAEKYSKELRELKPTIKNSSDLWRISKVETPEGEDINSLLDGHEPKILTELLNQRTSFSFSSDGYRVEKEKPNSSTGVLAALAKVETQDPVPSSQNLTPNTTLNTENPEQITYQTTQLKITIWGGIEKENLSRLKISLHIRSSEGKSFRDDVNLYSHVSSKKLIQNIAETLELSTSLITNTIADLTEKLEAYRMEERAAQVQALKPKLYEMTDNEVRAAQALLKSPDLVKNTLHLISQSGLIGEQKNGLLLFFLYLSRFFDEPLHAIIFGRSGSGKTYLQKKIAACLPEESVRTITSLTENTLYYSSKGFWAHKVLLIEDLDGVYNAFLPLREFMSNQSITKLTTDKDAKGNNVQKVLTVEGPICVSGATTKEGIYEDNANRSYLLHINEGATHMEEVMDFQRKLQAGLVDENSQELAKQLLKNCQRLLHPTSPTSGGIRVVNPYATQLKIPDSVFKKLRTNMHYLRLIEIITFYHQHQREHKKDSKGKHYIETTLEDISWANRLTKESLLRKSDELNGDLRKFFEILKSKYEKEKVFFAKEVRKALRLHPMKVARQLTQLENRGYIKRTGGHRNTGYEYEIISWDEYEVLKQGIDVLDSILDEIREREAKKALLSDGQVNGKAAGITSASQVQV